MTAEGVIRVAIAGSGVAGAMAAAVLARALPHDRYAITVVPSGDGDDSLGGFGEIETSLPSIRGFHAGLGLSEDRLITAGASFSLGTGYGGWAGAAGAYFVPFADIGAAIDGVPFHQLAQRLRADGHKVRLGDYSVATMMAQSGRFARPLDDARSVLSTYSYGLNVACDAYAAILLAIAEDAGAVRSERPFERIDLAEDGSIAALVLSGGERIETDLVIDASGAGRGPMSRLPEAEFEDWSHWLPCDRVVGTSRRTAAPPPPYVLVEAHANGWKRTVPAQDRVGLCVAYASERMSDDDALIMLGAGDGSEPRVSSAKAGRVARPWLRNCVAIGSAAAVLEPTASTSLHLVQAALMRLVELFPTGRDATTEAREYNRLTAQELDRTRDFAMLRYRLNGRSGDPFWDAVRASEMPEELAHKATQYSKRGRVPLLDGDLFDESEWALIFDEHNVVPERYDVLADAMPAAELAGQLARMRQVMAAAVRGVPLHGDFLARLPRSAAA